MQSKQIIIDVTADTPEGLNAAVRAAAQSLLDSPQLTVESDSFIISHGPDDKGYSPNTLLFLGTNAKGKVVLRGSRTSFDASADFHIMETALAFSEATDRGVSIPENLLGSLLVRSATPLPLTGKAYALRHITDLVQVDDLDIPGLQRELPALIGFLKTAKKCTLDIQGELRDIIPQINWKADGGTDLMALTDNGTTRLGSGSQAYRTALEDNPGTQAV